MNAKAVNQIICAIEKEALHRFGESRAEEAYRWMVEQWDTQLGPHNIQVRVWNGKYEWQEVKND
jgi:hypothetical protein